MILKSISEHFLFFFEQILQMLITAHNSVKDLNARPVVSHVYHPFF